ncbi:MAG TPA: hypothetical protein PLZ36_09350 [Armatimonadota bacterium]|nr:hypothetical protein [Armatimonadota bacterium]HOS43748.1 hypothetical protein [Armatimonadota bacterium]
MGYGVLLVGLALLAGCGGGGGSSPAPGALIGQWVEASPAAQPAWQAGEHIRWPTRMITLRDDDTFLYEEDAPENRVAGFYTVDGHTLRFSRVVRQGQVAALAAGAVAHAVLGDTLGIVEETPDGDRILQFARVTPTIPPALAGEWIAARRLDSRGIEQPLPASTRLTIAAGGAVEQACYLPSNSRFAVTSGGLLLTTTGRLGVRLTASGAALGQLDILGDYTVRDGALTVQAPDGSRLCYVSRAAPDPRLAVEWRASSGGVATTLHLRPDGVFTRTRDGVTATGEWRAYTDRYLCLITAGAQETYAWELWMQSTNRILRLGRWVPLGDDACQYQQTTWQYWDQTMP